MVALVLLCSCNYGGGLLGRIPPVVWYVDVDAPGGGDGTSWATAFRHPQDAVDAACPGDEVWVAEGVYGRRSSEDVVSLTMRRRIALYGGFTGTESTRDGRDWRAHVAILDGEDEAVHVVVGADDALLDGFTVTGGYARVRPGDPESYDRGGGMYNYCCSPVVANCTFSMNSAWACGGGMYNHRGSPTVEGCLFIWNSAHGRGGGMYNHLSKPTVTSSGFNYNSASELGGGMYNHGSSPAVTECGFEYNSASESGGGMYNCLSSPALNSCVFDGNVAHDRHGGAMHNYRSSPTVSGCAFNVNRSYDDGGAMYNDGSSPTVTGCTFSGNSSSVSAGGMCNYGSFPKITDCIFSGNTAGGWGGGVLNDRSSPSVIRCTFSGNRGNYGGGMCNCDDSSVAVVSCVFSDNWANDGGGMCNFESASLVVNCTFNENSAGGDGTGIRNSYESSLRVTNCILWDQGHEINSSLTSDVLVTYSNIRGGYRGTGNMHLDPGFVNPPDDLHLSPGSPCIDAADGRAAPDEDKDGNPRADDPSTPNRGKGPAWADIGSYEYQPE